MNKRKVILNIVWSISVKVIIPILSFFLVPYLINRIGILEFGLIGLSKIFAVAGYIGLLDFGFQVVIIKYTAEYFEKKEYGRLNKLLCTSLILYLIIGIFALIVAISFLHNFTVWFNIPSSYNESFKSIIKIVFFCYLFEFPDLISKGVISGLQRFDVLKGIELISYVAYTLLTLIIIYFNGNYLHIILLTCILSLLQTIYRFYIVFKIVPEIKIKFNYFDLGIMKDVKYMAKYNFMTKLSNVVYNKSDRILIGFFLGPLYIGLFEILERLPQFIKQLSGTASELVMPASSQYFATGNSSLIFKEILIRGLNFNLCFIYPVISAAIYFASFFLEIWVGKEYAYLTSMLQCFLLWNFLTPIINYGQAILIGMNKNLKQLTIGNWTGTIIKFILSIILIEKYKLNAIVLSTVISIIVILPWFFHIYRKELDFKIFVFGKDFFSIFIIVFIPLSILTILDSIINTNNLSILVLKGCTWCFVYWISLYFTVMHKKNKLYIIEIIKRIIKKIKRNKIHY